MLNDVMVSSEGVWVAIQVMGVQLFWPWTVSGLISMVISLGLRCFLL